MFVCVYACLYICMCVVCVFVGVCMFVGVFVCNTNLLINYLSIKNTCPNQLAYWRKYAVFPVRIGNSVILVK